MLPWLLLFLSSDKENPCRFYFRANDKLSVSCTQPLEPATRVAIVKLAEAGWLVLGGIARRCAPVSPCGGDLPCTASTSWYSHHRWRWLWPPALQLAPSPRESTWNGGTGADRDNCLMDVRCSSDLLGVMFCISRVMPVANGQVTWLCGVNFLSKV